MQLLELPMTSNPMIAKLSLSGVTLLKAGNFKKRHYGCNDYYETPQGRFVHRDEYKKIFPDEFKKPKKKKSAAAKNSSEKKLKCPRLYCVDKKKVSHRILNFYKAQRGEKMLYFWTVSFPLKTSDDTGYRLLNKWLTRLRQEKILRSYLWIAERQQNGTIHYHIAVNQKMNVQKANRYMRAAIATEVEKGTIKWDRVQVMRYNGVDLAKDRKTKRVINFAKGKKSKALSSYLTKYVTKNNEKFNHLAWHCSRDYSNLVTAFTLTESEFNVPRLQAMIDFSEPLESDFYTFFRWKDFSPDSIEKYLTFVNGHIQDLMQQLP